MNLSQQETIDSFQIFMAKSGYKFIQTKSQRIYTQSPLVIQPPPKGTEIFIGKLPFTIYDDKLFSIFCKIGPIFMMRIMTTIIGNRGFAFITYFSCEHARMAVRLLNSYTISADCNINVHISFDNRCLFIGNIPKEKTNLEIMKELKSYMKGVVNIIIYKEPSNLNLNRSFVFVEFETHGKAEMARRQFRGHLVLWGKLLSIDWANTIPTINPRVLEKITTLFLRNIPIHYSSNDLTNFLNRFLPLGMITKVCKSNHFAFVHFTDKKTAEFALKFLKGLRIENNQIEAEWARPKSTINKITKYEKSEL